jgi:hypothetical protein
VWEDGTLAGRTPFCGQTDRDRGSTWQEDGASVAMVCYNARTIVAGAPQGPARVVMTLPPEVDANAVLAVHHDGGAWTLALFGGVLVRLDEAGKLRWQRELPIGNVRAFVARPGLEVAALSGEGGPLLLDLHPRRLQRLIIQPPFVQQGDDTFRELGGGARKPRLQPREPAGFGGCFCLRRRDFSRRRFQDGFREWGRGFRNRSRRRLRRVGNRDFGLGRATAAQTAKEIAQRHQAASAKSPSASAPVTRKRRISPGCPALPNKRSGAKYSVWPRSGCSNKTCSSCPSLAA